MNHATQELTSSLQEMTARLEQMSAFESKPLPNNVAAGELATSSEVEIFVERSQSYTAQTRSVNVGSY
jgi:hypothetical protein